MLFRGFLIAPLYSAIVLCLDSLNEREVKELLSLEYCVVGFNAMSSIVEIPNAVLFVLAMRIVSKDKSDRS